MDKINEIGKIFNYQFTQEELDDIDKFRKRSFESFEKLLHENSNDWRDSTKYRHLLSDKDFQHYFILKNGEKIPNNGEGYKSNSIGTFTNPIKHRTIQDFAKSRGLTIKQAISVSFITEDYLRDGLHFISARNPKDADKDKIIEFLKFGLIKLDEVI